MKMPMNWAKEFAEFECTPQEFADRMTMSGSKVETYECEADGIKNVVVGKILEIVPHPDSDHMVGGRGPRCAGTNRHRRKQPEGGRPCARRTARGKAARRQGDPQG